MQGESYLLMVTRRRWDLYHGSFSVAPVVCSPGSPNIHSQQYLRPKLGRRTASPAHPHPRTMTAWSVQELGRCLPLLLLACRALLVWLVGAELAAKLAPGHRGDGPGWRVRCAGGLARVLEEGAGLKVGGCIAVDGPAVSVVVAGPGLHVQELPASVYAC